MHKINHDQAYVSSVALKSCQSSNPHNIHTVVIKLGRTWVSF